LPPRILRDGGSEGRRGNSTIHDYQELASIAVKIKVVGILIWSITIQAISNKLTGRSNHPRWHHSPELPPALPPIVVDAIEDIRSGEDWCCL